MRIEPTTWRLPIANTESFRVLAPKRSCQFSIGRRPIRCGFSIANRQSSIVNSSAFTLIELILVMMLLVITTALVAPSLAGFFRGRTLDSEAQQLLSLTRAGQSRAVSEGEPILLWVDAKQNTYGLQEETPPADGDPKAITLNAADSVQIQVENQTRTPVTLGNLPAIRFLPGGTIDENSPQALRLTDARGNTLWLVESANHMGYEIRTAQ